jgi:hypothetical protein
LRQLLELFLPLHAKSTQKKKGIQNAHRNQKRVPPKIAMIMGAFPQLASSSSLSAFVPVEVDGATVLSPMILL